MFLEFSAVIFTLISIWLSIKQSIATWIYGIIGVICYFIIFYKAKLYAESILQIIFFIQSLYGLYKWEKFKNVIKIERLNFLDKIKYFILLSLSIFITCLILYFFTDSKHIFLDSSTAILSIFANYLLAKKILDAWFLWIIVDFLLIILFILTDLHLSAFLYFMFLVMAIKGLINWKKDLKQD